jgi:hypothetical protein
MSDWASDVNILGIFFPIEGGQGYPTVDGKSFAMKHLIVRNFLFIAFFVQCSGESKS